MPTVYFHSTNQYTYYQYHLLLLLYYYSNTTITTTNSATTNYQLLTITTTVLYYYYYYCCTYCMYTPSTKLNSTIKYSEAYGFQRIPPTKHEAAFDSRIPGIRTSQRGGLIRAHLCTERPPQEAPPVGLGTSCRISYYWGNLLLLLYLCAPPYGSVVVLSFPERRKK